MPKGPTLSSVAAAVLLACMGLSLSACGKGAGREAAAPTPLPATTVAATPAGAPAADPAAAPLPAPPPPDPCASIGTLAEAKGPIHLNAGRVVRLAPVCSTGDLTAHLRAYGQDTRFILVADDLRAGVQPGGAFELRLGPPTGTEAAVIGAINVYAAQGPGGVGQPHSVSFDVTEPVRSLAVSGWPAQGLGVAMAPSGPAAPNSDATVGAVRLVAQAPR